MANPTVTFNTTMGSITAEIFLDKVPVTASNFLDLANSGFYNGIHFHRVIPDFMAQFGCPYARDPRSNRAGTGGPQPGSQYRNLLTGEVITRGDDGQGGGTIRDEFTARISNERGTLSMANTGSPDTGGSQFFMNVVHNESLDWFDNRTESRHPVFGLITRGMEVVDAITRAPTSNDSPATPIQMISVSVQQSAAPAAQPAGAGAMQAPVVRQRVGEWAICDSPQGVLYHHTPTGQTFDQPPPQLAQFLAAQKAQEQQRLVQQQQQQMQQQQQQQMQQQQMQQQQMQQMQLQQQQQMQPLQQQQPQYQQMQQIQQQPQVMFMAQQAPQMQQVQQVLPPVVQQVQPPSVMMAPQASYAQQTVYAGQPQASFAQQQAAVYGQPSASYGQQLQGQFYQQPVRQY
jgi:cyclophilin family peptidyl-prolyl cis-trans isomerase